MRALLPMVLAVVVASVPSSAGAARKKDGKSSAPPPQDSVLRIPRLAKAPDLEALLQFVGLSGISSAKARTAKSDRGRLASDGSAASAGKEERIRKPSLGDVPGAAADSTAARPEPAKPPPDSTLHRAPLLNGIFAPAEETPLLLSGLVPSGPSGTRTVDTGGLALPLAIAGAAVLIAGERIRRRRPRGPREAGRDPGRASERDRREEAETDQDARAEEEERDSRDGFAPGAGRRAARAGRKPSRLRQMFLANLWREKGRLSLAALFMLGGAAVELLKPWPLKVVLDHVLLDNPMNGVLAFLQGISWDRTTMLVASSVAIVAISVISGLFSYLQIFITKGIGFRMVYAVRREVFSHLQRLSLSFHNRARSGDLLTTFGKDTSTLKDVFAEALLRFTEQALTMAGMLAIMWFVNWKLCLVATGTLPFLLLTLTHLYGKTKSSLKLQRRQEGRVVSRVNEVLSSTPLVQAFGRERYEEERYDVVSNASLRESLRMTRLEAAATRSTYMISAVGTGLVVLFGGTEVLQGRMLPGELVLVMSYLTSMYKPLRNLAKLSTELSKAAASADRIADVLGIDPDIEDRPDAIEAREIRGDIVFDSVSFDYGDGREVLRDVSFKVSSGQRVALVGASGAGKTTIASLVLRLYEAQRGAILIDGVPISRYRRESLRRQIGIVLQESLLFGASIRENIAYGKPEASLEEIVAAAKTANADEFIRELEDGYEAVVGERGATLSAGQRQRVAIARAVVRDPRILILDEPMRGLDAVSESKVREALDRLMENRTSIVITHDLQSIPQVDQVLVLEEGEIVSSGFDTSLANRGVRLRGPYGLDPAAAHAVGR